ncbi:MAG: acylphosphatase [Nitrospinota bacterium]
MARTRVKVRVFGAVQGVCFRMETKKKADSLGVKGWVKNNIDGSVDAAFEGEQDAVDAAVKWCRLGPPLARVERTETDSEPVTGKELFFEIKY